jgi:hypothetical protein
MRVRMHWVPVIGLLLGWMEFLSLRVCCLSIRVLLLSACLRGIALCLAYSTIPSSQASDSVKRRVNHTCLLRSQ